MTNYFVINSIETRSPKCCVKLDLWESLLTDFLMTYLNLETMIFIVTLNKPTSYTITAYCHQSCIKIPISKFIYVMATFLILSKIIYCLFCYNVSDCYFLFSPLLKIPFIPLFLN